MSKVNYTLIKNLSGLEICIYALFQINGPPIFPVLDSLNYIVT